MRFLSLYVLAILCYFVSPNTTKAQYFTPADSQQVMIDVTYLASDMLEGRMTGTKGEALAADYLSMRMQQLNLDPQPGHETYVQSFDFEMRQNPHGGEAQAVTGKNVVGFINNNAEETIIIGAHYDHLGYGNFSSLHTGEPAVHNGADDNASGTAALLYLAEKLQREGGPRNRNYLFIAFSAEELGLVGSKRWVAAARGDLDIVAMFNMDMVGRLRNKKNVLAVYGTGTSPLWNPALDQAEKMLGLVTVRDSSGVGGSDHTSFYLDDIPVLAAFTGQHSDYHKPSDDAELIDYGGIVKVSEMLYSIMEKLDQFEEIPFQKTTQKKQQRAASFKVTLGVMPDYVYAGKGMKIDGVTEGRPAEKAGIKAGDIIVKMGDLDIKDIYDYMEGLSKNKVGNTTTVIVNRNGEMIELEVTF